MKLSGDMQGRIVVYFSLGFVLGAVFCGTILFLRQSAFEATFLMVAAPVGAIVSTFFIPIKRSSTSVVVAAFFCGCLAYLSGGLERGDFSFFSKAEKLKENFSEYLDGFFGEDAAENSDETAVLKALAIGDKEGLDSGLKREYKTSGAMHLLALSGLHIGIIYAFLSFSLTFLGKGRYTRHLKRIIILSLLWGYAVVTGLGNSISRAVTMITVYELTGVMQSKKDLLRALAVSAFITTLLNPSAPFQIGFQLSYSSVLATRFLFPRMKNLMQTRSGLLEAIWNTLAMSVCCQAATAPLSLLYFGTLPRYFMITNLLAIPITGIVMYTIPVALCLKSLRPILFWCLSLLNRIIHIVAGIE